MPTITFTLVRDSTGLAGAVRAIRGGADYVVPTAELSSLPTLQTNAPLPASGTYTGAWRDRYDDAFVTRLRAQAIADAAGTLYLEQSPDATTATQITSLPVAANTPGDTSWWPLAQRWYRLRYVNGGSGQSLFMLYLETDVPHAGLHAGVGALTDRSGTITAANASQQVCAANPARRYLLFQNLSANPMWLNFSGAATLSQPSMQVPSGNPPASVFSMERSFVSYEALNVICGTTGSAFTCKEGS